MSRQVTGQTETAGSLAETHGGLRSSLTEGELRALAAFCAQTLQFIHARTDDPTISRVAFGAIAHIDHLLNGGSR